MSSLGRFFSAERVKWRKSWVLVAMALAPLCQSGFLAVILWFSEDLVRRFKPGFEFWIELNYLAWGLLFMPILAALIVGLSWELESDSRTWNLLLAQPAPPRTHYLVKLLSHFSLLLLSQVILAALLILEGFILQKHMPDRWGPFPPILLLQFAGYSVLASIPLVAFHTWLSHRISGLGIGLGVALGGTWLCTRMPAGTALVQVIPWGMSSQVLGFFDRWHRHIPWTFIPGCFLITALVIALGTLDFSRAKSTRR